MPAKSPPPTQEEIQLAQDLFDAGHTYAEISRVFGHSASWSHSRFRSYLSERPQGKPVGKWGSLPTELSVLPYRSGDHEVFEFWYTSEDNARSSLRVSYRCVHCERVTSVLWYGFIRSVRTCEDCAVNRFKRQHGLTNDQYHKLSVRSIRKAGRTSLDFMESDISNLRGLHGYLEGKFTTYGGWTTVPAVYRLWDNEEVVYVGATTNIQARLGTHSRHKQAPLITHVDYFDCSDDPNMVFEYEDAYIFFSGGTYQGKWTGSNERD